MDEPSSKRAAAAIAAAALGGLWYLLLQGWTPHFFFGVFFASSICSGSIW